MRHQDPVSTSTWATMDTPCLPRRIIKETQRLQQEPVPGIVAIPDDANARYFHVVRPGGGGGGGACELMVW